MPEGLNWMKYGVPGLQDPTNLPVMDYAVKNMPAEGAVIEIGSFAGLSSCMLGWCLERHGRRQSFITCDEWIFEGAEGGGSLAGMPSVSHQAYRRYIMDVCRLAQVTFLPDHPPYTVMMSSDEFFRNWDASSTAVDLQGRQVRLGGKIAFAFIDGNHTYPFVERDFNNVARHLATGGMVLFDDSADFMGSEVTRFIRGRVLSDRRYRLVSRTPNYLIEKVA